MAAIVAPFVPTQTEAAKPKLVFHRATSSKRADRIEVDGLSAAQQIAISKKRLTRQQWQQLFAVTVVSASSKTTTKLPPMLGRYRISRERIVFEPRYSLQPGLKYRAVFRPSRLPDSSGKEPAVELVILIPKAKPTPAATVTAVFPSRKTLPENLLKFYIHFSEPMSRGEAYRRIALLDAQGKTVANPFLELGEELWDRSGTRFTLFIDPGRIKRGLKPREDIGPVFEQGKSYTLVISSKWIDAKSRPLKAAFQKKFQVGPPDTTQLDPNNWRVTAPKAGTRKPLTVRFPESIDNALLHRMLVVTNARGLAIDGDIHVSRYETHWRFTPKKPWPAGRHSLAITTTLEDLAGNSIGRLFEVDVVRPIRKSVKKKTVSLPFRVTP